MNEKTRKTALKALDGMAEVIRNEMLLHGRYISLGVERPELAAAGAVCGGHRACAVGALYLGAGEKLQWGRGRGNITLPGSEPWQREEHMASRPGLRLAYDTLNEVAAKKHPRLLNRVVADTADDYDDDGPGHVKEVGAMEALFESGYLGRGDEETDNGLASKAEQRKLLAIIDIAREQIASA